MGMHKLLQIRPNQADVASPELAVDLVIVDEVIRSASDIKYRAV